MRRLKQLDRRTAPQQLNRPQSGRAAAGWATLLLFTTTAAAAEPSPIPPVTIGAASIGAVDVERDARFYEAVFGLQEIRRIDDRPQFLEIVLKPGSDATAARTAPGAALILISHPASATADLPGLQGWARAHLLLVVPEMGPVLSRTTANGGSVAIAPTTAKGSLESEVQAHPGGAGTHVDAMIEDPEGNFVELLAAK
jgi:catechol 2,3-dioxygenase-like lactoylglutathione lyase family enzyme